MAQSRRSRAARWSWQDPPPEMVLPPNTTVELVLSAGPAPVTVPDVVGLAEPFAEKIIEAAGIKVGSVDTVRGGDEAGVVIATRPPSGHGRPRGHPGGPGGERRPGGGTHERADRAERAERRPGPAAGAGRAGHRGRGRVDPRGRDGRPFRARISPSARPIIRALRRITDRVIDVHLMVRAPGALHRGVRRRGRERLHLPSRGDRARAAPARRRARAGNAVAGLALNPGTPLALIEEVVDDVDLVLIMSVNPGYGGQSYLPQATDKIRRTRALLDRAGSRAVLEVDGGITTATIAEAWSAGRRHLRRRDGRVRRRRSGRRPCGTSGAAAPCRSEALMSRQWTIVLVVVAGLALGAAALTRLAPTWPRSRSAPRRPSSGVPDLRDRRLGVAARALRAAR